jgi:hypothetical protein
MAILSDSDRQLVARDWVRKIFVELATTANMSHASIKSAVDAADQWADDNATAFNSALPVPFRTTATTAQKTLLLSYVILKRAGII